MSIFVGNGIWEDNWTAEVSKALVESTPLYQRRTNDDTLSGCVKTRVDGWRGRVVDMDLRL